MSFEENEILDLPEDNRPKPKEFYTLRFASTLLMAFGLVGRMQHWPWSKAILVTGILLWTVWNLIHFFSRKNPILMETMYFGGRLALAVAVFLMFFGRPAFSNYIFGAAAIFFLIGFFSAPKGS